MYYYFRCYYLCPYRELSARVDNLSSTWASIASICDVGENAIDANCNVLVAISWDNEEVGSVSFTGADGAVLEQWLQQAFSSIQKNKEISEDLDFASILRNSFLISCDSTFLFEFFSFS